jgi:Mor family transcriptional regulator
LPLEYPDRLRELALTAYARLLTEMHPEDAPGMHRVAWLAFAVVESFREEHGGANFYLMAGKSYLLTQRDREMMGRYTGNNIPELAREYGLSEPHVRRIVSAWYQEYRKTRQPQLPLEP